MIKPNCISGLFPCYVDVDSDNFIFLCSEWHGFCFQDKSNDAANGRTGELSAVLNFCDYYSNERW